MHGRRSSGERRERQSRAGGARALREDVPLGPLERPERGKPATREQADGAADSAADARLQRSAGGEQPARPLRLELERARQLRARAVEHSDAEATPVLRRQIDAAELEVTRHVLQEVDELEPGADVVARADE